MTVVFISHSSKDGDFVESKLIPLLKSNEIRPWYSPTDIQTAEEWEREIFHGLQSCDWFLVVMSPHAVDSDWVRTEVHWAIENRIGRVIPIMLQTCNPADLHLKLLRIQFVDFRGSEELAFKKLLWTWQMRTSTFDKGASLPPPMKELEEAAKPEPRDDENRKRNRNRKQMLQKVRSTWVSGYLEPSLSSEAHLELTLYERPDAVASPWAPFVNKKVGARPTIWSRTATSTIFNQFGDGLLILGGSGAGKTILLLELTRHLLDQAERDEDFWIPVVFQLSTWAVQHRTLEQWLVDELHDKYTVPRKVAADWVKTREILPMLDGLDEVSLEHRQSCVDSINTFRQEHGVPVAVSSRTEDYIHLTRKLQLPRAVIVQPLTRSEVEQYIGELGDSVTALRMALNRDPELWQLLDTPLMLSIAVRTYKHAQIGDIGRLSSDRLFSNYIDAMFSHGSGPEIFPQARTIHWLKWLAKTMTAEKQSIFMLEHLRKDLLPQDAANITQALSALSIGILFALLFVSMGPVAGSSITLLGALIIGFFGWSNIALRGRKLRLFGVTLKFGEFVRDRPVDRLGWSWRQVWKKSSFILRVMMPRLGIPIIILPVLITARTVGPLAALAVATIGLTLMFYSRLLQDALVPVEEVLRSSPNEGLRHSARNCLLVLLLGGLPLGLAFGLYFGMRYGVSKGILLGVIGGLYCGLISALSKGAFFCIHHFILRLMIWRCGYAPLRYIRFLNYGVKLIFLRRVGGGYVFVHRRLMEYFGSLR